MKVNRKQLFIKPVNHTKSIQESVTEKSAQIITTLLAYINPQAKINKPGGWH